MSRTRMARLQAEVRGVASRFGPVRWDDEDGLWLLVEHYPLPPGLSKRTSKILIDIPREYPAIPPDGWYMDIDVTRVDAERLAHLIVADSSLNKHADLGYGWFCVHVDPATWHPVAGIWGGDNLVGYFEWIALQLSGAPK